MPRNRKDKPSPKAREERIRIRFLDDPWMGDVEAARADLEARLQRHADALGFEELCRRVRARGLDLPPGADFVLEVRRKAKEQGLPLPHPKDIIEEAGIEDTFEIPLPAEIFGKTSL